MDADPARGTIVAYAAEDNRLEGLRQSAVEHARDQGARLILYDVDAAGFFQRDARRRPDASLASRTDVYIGVPADVGHGGHPEPGGRPRQVALTDAYSWVKFVHILAVLGFLAAHGVSIGVAFKLRGERDRARVRALLDLSRASLSATYGALAVLVVAGILAGIMGGWFTRSLWIWLGLVLLFGIMVAMYYLGTSHFNELRKAAGLPYAIGSRRQPAVDPVSEGELAILVATGRPWTLAVIGFGGIAVIAFLMLFKPF